MSSIAAFAVLLPDIQGSPWAHQRRCPAARVAHHDRGAADRSAAVLLLRPAEPGHASRRSAPPCGPPFRSAPALPSRWPRSGWLIAARRRRYGAGRRHARPLVAALRLLRAGGAVKVFSAHRQANSVGQILGPLWPVSSPSGSGWNGPSTCSPSRPSCSSSMALRLREPVRGYHERIAAGLTKEVALVADRHETAWSTMKVLHKVRTIRRIWLATPFLGVALFGIPNLLSLVYEEVFGLDSAARGAIAAGVEPLQVIGVFVAMPRVARSHCRSGLPVAVRRARRSGGRVPARDPRLRAHVAIAVMPRDARGIDQLRPRSCALVSIVAPARVARPPSRRSPCSPSPASRCSSRSSAWCPTSSASRRAWS